MVVRLPVTGCSVGLLRPPVSCCANPKATCALRPCAPPHPGPSPRTVAHNAHRRRSIPDGPVEQPLSYPVFGLQHARRSSSRCARGSGLSARRRTCLPAATAPSARSTAATVPAVQRVSAGRHGTCPGGSARLRSCCPPKISPASSRPNLCRIWRCFGRYPGQNYSAVPFTRQLLIMPLWDAR
jgi:hypothetical protein